MYVEEARLIVSLSKRGLLEVCVDMHILTKVRTIAGMYVNTPVLEYPQHTYSHSI